ncbi:site-specific integrase [Galbibacter sp. PAP.153]|uniref:site-specific integrase n=1 Tax=Galbibacter sp. PAP.153 TaxID=3104623 RepID=UPI00300B88E6
MHQEKLSILYVVSKTKTNKRGVCPIICRITFKKKRKPFNTGLFVNPDDWNSKKQLAESNGKNNAILNAELSLIKTKIEKSYLKLQLEENDFIVDDILQKYLNKKIKKEDGVVSYFKKYLDKQEKLIGKDIQKATWNKFNYVCNHVVSFIYSKYRKKDYPLEKLNQQFLNDFEYYLKTAKSQKQVTINKSIQRFRKPIKIALSEGYLDKDPFMLHKPKRVIKSVVFLSQKELEKIENHSFHQSRLELVRDLFIFCCYTGLAYNEMNNLKKHHLIDGFDGNKWIQMKRQKTGKDISVPLLPKAFEILLKYNSESESNTSVIN